MTMTHDELLDAYGEAYHAAELAGHPDPRASADRYVQGLELGAELRSCPTCGASVACGLEVADYYCGLRGER